MRFFIIIPFVFWLYLIPLAIVLVTFGLRWFLIALIFPMLILGGARR